MPSPGLVVPSDRAFMRVIAVVGLLLAAALLMVGYADRADAAPGTCTRYWTGAASTAWGTNGNWSNTNGGAASTVPGAADVACMSTSPTRQTLVVSDARSVAGFTLPAAGSVLPVLQVNSGANLTVGTSAVDSYDSVVNTLTLQTSSTFGGRAPVTAGTIGNLGGVTLSGTGSLTLAGGGNAMLSSGTSLYLDGGYTFVNSGAVTSNDGQVYFIDGKVTNKSTWTLKNPSTAPLYDPYQLATSTFTNLAGATVSVSPTLASSTTTFSSKPVINNGTLNVTKGILSLQVDESGTGSWLVASGASLNLDSGTFDGGGATLSGAGTVNLNSGGKLKGTSAATATITFNGGTLVGGGTVTVPAATAATITTADLYIDGGTTLVNNGTLTSNDGQIYFIDGKVVNNGTWTLKNPTTPPLYDPYQLATSTFTNSSTGTLNVSPANAADTTTFSSKPVINNGTLTVTKGILSLQVDESGTGSWAVASGASLNLDAGIFDGGGATLSGAGTVNLNSGGKLKGTSAAIATITFNGGTLVGGGTVTLPVATTATITTADLYIDEGTTLVNNGTLTSNDGQVYFIDGKVVNNGTWTLKNPATAPLYDPYQLATSTFTNAATGTLNVSPVGVGDTTTLSSKPVINNGTLNVTKGILSLQVDESGTGSWLVASGASLNLDGGTFDGTGATLSGAGMVNLDNGGSMKGTVAATATITFNGGTLVGAATVTVPAATVATITTADLYIDGGTTLVNNGTVTSNDGQVYFIDGKVVNNGTWTLKNPTTSPVYDPYQLATSTFTNSATGLMDVALASQSASMPLNSKVVVNNGTFRVSQGGVSVTSGFTGTGTYDLAAGTKLNLDGGTLSMSGTAQVIGDGALWDNSSGTITGTGTARNVVFNNGAVSGAGTLTLATGGVSQIPSGATMYLQNTVKLVNLGTLNQAGGVYETNNPTLTNQGTWNWTFSATGATNGDGLNKNPWVNAATGLITSSPGAATTADLGPIRLTNAGEIRALTGITNVSLTNLTSAGVMTGGAITAQGGVLGLNANLVTNSGTVTVVSGGINNTSTGTSALPALRTSNGVLTLSQSVNGTGAVTNTGTVWLKGGTFRPTTYTQTGGSTRVDAPAVLRGGTAGTGAVAINGGTLLGGGTVEGPLTNAATVQPGGAGTPLTVTGTYTQGSAGTFAAVVTGSTTVGTDYSKLTASGAASLSGALAIQTGAGYNPAVGTTVRILDAASRTGTFSSITGRETLPAGKYWAVAYDATGVTLTVAADPVATVTSPTVTEGNTGTTPMTFTVSLDQASQRTVSYNYATVAGTATAPSDYAVASGTLTFAPGETSKTVTVQVNGDTTFEPDETLTLVLSGASNGAIGGTGTGTITNDDPAPPVVAVTAVSPGSIGQAASGVVLTVAGTGFDPTSAVTFSKAGFTQTATQYVDEHTLKVTVNVSPGTAAGGTSVTVTGVNGSATCVNCLVITARPTITSTTPGSLGAGAFQREVTINGSGFQPGAKATIAGAAVLSTSYIDANTLEVLATVPEGRAPGTMQVGVANPDQGKNSCTTCFSSTAGPTVTAVSPASWARGTTFTLTVTGTNLAPGVKLVGPAGVTIDGVVRVNDTTVTATVTVDLAAKVGSGQKLVVTNPASRGYGRVTFAGITITS